MSVIHVHLLEKRIHTSECFVQFTNERAKDLRRFAGIFYYDYNVLVLKSGGGGYAYHCSLR